MNTFAGMRIIKSPYLEEDGPPITIKRTWRERLFSRPWRPFVKTRTEIPKIPYSGAVKLNANTLVMHPATVLALQKELEKVNPYYNNVQS